MKLINGFSEPTEAQMKVILKNFWYFKIKKDEVDKLPKTKQEAQEMISKMCNYMAFKKARSDYDDYDDIFSDYIFYFDPSSY